MEQSRWVIHNNRILELIQEESSDVKIAQIILGTNEAAGKNHEVNMLRSYVNRFRSKNKGILESCEGLSTDPSTVKHLWKKNKGSSLFVKNPNYKEPETIAYEKLQAALVEDIQKYSPKFPVIKREEDPNAYLLVIDPADIHIGKLCSSFQTGEAYNNQIAVKRVIEGVKGILQKTSSYKIDKILFIGGNDILHIDNPRRTTTSGTPQDTDGMWHSNFLIAKQLYIDVLEILIAVADVHFVFNPSNHDYTNGYFLANVIETYFRYCKNITFDCSIAHRKGFKYHNNLIGSTHGDGAKQDLLPLLMAQEFPIEWAGTKHRYIYTHHIHHKTAKDYPGVTVESLRSPSGTDSWHHNNGYEHAPKAVEGFIHCKIHGQIARITHIF